MKICIEGNIGCGKSTCLNKLSGQFQTYLEPVNEWNDYLKKFYDDQKKWSLCFNLQVIYSFNRVLQIEKNFPNHPIICERSPFACRNVFTQLGFENNYMTELELATFDNIYKLIGWMPDVLIYIRTNPEICMERVQKRNRECEKDITLEYLKELHDRYERITHKKMHVVDGNKSSDHVLQQIQDILSLYATTGLKVN